jgi:hypothetical protein
VKPRGILIGFLRGWFAPAGSGSQIEPLQQTADVQYRRRSSVKSQSRKARRAGRHFSNLTNGSAQEDKE